MKKRERKSEVDVILISLANIGRCLILYSNTDLCLNLTIAAVSEATFTSKKKTKFSLINSLKKRTVVIMYFKTLDHYNTMLSKSFHCLENHAGVVLKVTLLVHL